MADAQNQAPKFVAKKIGNITLPLMKIAQNTDYFVRFTGDIHLGKEVANQAKVDPNTGEIIGKQEPAFVAFVDNLETEEPVQIIAATVLRKELEEAYPNQGYVGRCFQFSMQKPAGKRYHVPQLYEIEDPHPEKGQAARAAWEVKSAASAPSKGGDANEAAASTEPEAKTKGGKK